MNISRHWTDELENLMDEILKATVSICKYKRYKEMLNSEIQLCDQMIYLQSITKNAFICNRKSVWAINSSMHCEIESRVAR